eukprot:CAMPEP_0202355894 /NCGR_PEP_ID=MMETSP1126-20121109/10595_1 /ASSEMBLY_ACC=CAM_ASM_000457 /TAXON_ID=3047 /ORGANISM="Dunaliella tertiolecta, Strain CCMP1320" /LENGTH=132 /DNA_ID=CAMNT_0048948579 /DNA_START=112 /DNA_END=511 /DNA_ORIENTATION=+
MVQIARTPLSNNVAFHIALRKIFGLGSTTSLQISETCGISAELKVRDVKEPYIHKVAQYIQDNYTVGDQLRREVRQNILRLMDINATEGPGMTKPCLFLDAPTPTHRQPGSLNITSCWTQADRLQDILMTAQ